LNGPYRSTNYGVSRDHGRSLAKAVFLYCALGGAVVACALEPETSGVRQPAVAGKFYPGEAGKLRGAVEAYLDHAVPACGERPIALVAPHAGYVYSGQIAADAYRQVQDHEYDVVVVLGSNHTVPSFNSVSVYQGAGYVTPLGLVPIDQDLAVALLQSDGGASFQPSAHEREHSVEVQLPFVQVACPQARLVAAVVGDSSPELAARFGKALAEVLRGRRALIVASSDLSHYPGFDDANEVDRQVLAAVASLDPAAVENTITEQMGRRRPGLSTCACGEGPILVAMAAARELGAQRGIALSYANSGATVFGETSRVVGYGAVAFTAGDGGPSLEALVPLPAPGQMDTLSREDREYLLGLARGTVEQYLLTGTVPLPRIGSPVLWRRQGAFVTLNKHGRLRGCIGHMAEDTPVALTVPRMALQAALRDTRFAPVQPDEIPALEFEISVLTPFAQVPTPDAILVGRDGVVLEKGGRRAVYLPQVAPEQGWDRDEMLGHLCQKAGMATGCWQHNAKLFTFQAEVFAEERAP